MEQKINPHAKHRQRMRDKVRKSGLLSLPEHEVLEIFLMYAIPRKDTNPIAHQLIQKFGSLEGVVSANIKDLEMVDGVGSEAALFLSLLGQFVDCYLKSKNNKKKYCLKTVEDSCEYFRSNFQVGKKEDFYIVCLNSQLKVVKTELFKGDNASMFSADTRVFARVVSSSDTDFVIAFHTHPHGSVNPTAEDMKATKRLSEICEVLGIYLLDHIIFSETEHYSFRGKGHLGNARDYINLRK